MTERVAFFSAQAVNQGVDLQASLSRVLARHWYVLGDEVKAFERDFAGYCGVDHCVSLANGTDALELSLRALGVGPGDEVLLVANAAFYGSTGVHLVGARPVYVDVDSRSLTMDPQALASALATHRPKAIIATHLYGQLAAIEQIAALAREHAVPLIEDCAQAHGARRGGRRAGSFGDIGSFSFYPTKNLGALGDGGAVVCRDAELAARVRSLRQYGWGHKYHNDLPMGRNSRLDELQAAVLNDKLPGLDAANASRVQIAAHYQAALARLPLVLPAIGDGDHVVHLYVVRTPQRDALRDFLVARGIGCDIHYPVPDHLQRAYAQSEPRTHLPQTEQACAQVLSLPCYAGMPPAHAQRVSEAVHAFFGSAA